MPPRIVGVALLDRYGSPVPVSAYAALMTVPALVALARARNARRRPRLTALAGARPTM